MHQQTRRKKSLNIKFGTQPETNISALSVFLTDGLHQRIPIILAHLFTKVPRGAENQVRENQHSFLQHESGSFNKDGLPTCQRAHVGLEHQGSDGLYLCGATRGPSFTRSPSITEFHSLHVRLSMSNRELNNLTSLGRLLLLAPCARTMSTSPVTKADTFGMAFLASPIF